MDRSRVTELHCIVDPDNLESIFELGILSHNEVAARGIAHVDLSNPDIQKLRKDKDVAFAGQARSRRLHSYANLFIDARNSMMSDLCFKYGHETLAVLKVRSDALELPGVVIADQNAASKYARFHASPGGLAHLAEEYVFAREWGDESVDQIDYWRRKSRRSAEVLVPDRVEPTYIEGVYVSCPETAQELEALDLPPVIVTMNADLFFQA